MSGALLEVRNLESYYGPVLAIRGISLDVPEGAIVCVLGANGAGKTTLLKTISGVLTPEKGAVRFAGEPITRQEPDAVVRRGIVHVPEGREIFPMLSVTQNLAMGAYTRADNDIAADRERVLDYFPVLLERMAQPAGTLSGGQQQMLAVARGLMARPKLMLLDEPSLGLSPLLVRGIFDVIRRLNEEHGISVLLVEQNARLALEIAHFGYVMETGRIVLDGPAEALKASRDVQEFYLGGNQQAARDDRRWKPRKSWR